MNQYYNYFQYPSYTHKDNRVKEMPDFFVANVGFSNGNMDKGLYDQFHNYVPKLLVPSNDKVGLMRSIQAVNFALIDLGLYLDTHPDDTGTNVLYGEYLDAYYKLVTEYETAYGPLEMICDAAAAHNNWNWPKGWPWERGE